MSNNVSKESLLQQRADVVVHNSGYPADMDEITVVSKRHHLLLVEDCAHAHASEWKNTRICTIRNLGAFSQIAGSQGDIILTNLRDKLCA